MIFFRNLERIRGLIGGAIILVSLLFIIPGFALLVSSNLIYGAPMTGYPITQELPTNGSLVSIELPMKSGFNYDVKYQLISIATDKSNSGSISVLVNSSTATNQLQDIPKGTFRDKGFNESTLFATTSFPKDLTADEILTMNFQVTSSENIVKTEIHISLYQNPNRELSSLASTLGIMLLIPGFIILIIGAVIAGSSQRDRMRRRDENRKVGKGEIYIDL